MIEVLLPCWQQPPGSPRRIPMFASHGRLARCRVSPTSRSGTWAEEFDLLVLDHPFMGTVAKGAYLVPLDNYISPAVLSNLRSESAGASHESYYYQGHQWALAIDAAAQGAGYRPDLLAPAGVTVPSIWEEVYELARIGQGFVTTPLLPVDSFCSFLTLCTSSGETPFAAGSHQVAGKEAGESALHQLKALGQCAIKQAHELNPIALWEKMSTTDEIAYCPLAFGYSNYARPGYRRSPIHFTNIPYRARREPAGSVLGGVGLAISARCREPSVAVEYALWVASADCQKTIYVYSGGQPGNRKAWIDREIDNMSNHHFGATLPTVEQAYLRPRFPGFVEFQSQASFLISDFLQGKHSSTSTLNSLDECFRKAALWFVVGEPIAEDLESPPTILASSRERVTLLADSLSRSQEKRTMRESEVHVGNSW